MNKRTNDKRHHCVRQVKRETPSIIIQFRQLFQNSARCYVCSRNSCKLSVKSQQKHLNGTNQQQTLSGHTNL